ncbi:MAG: adenine-specific methyltransferase EcoRI family protein [Paludibacteraceae bacterium]|nr:adenine-specific methyltransferase EcoRI family protein [Paludibacteraceae bacterium]
MAGNSSLHAAEKAKQDEFYTQLDDIAQELKYYKQHFKGKVVLCNCDDPYESNFFKYFALNFNQLGLKKLIATCYNGSPIAGDELPLLFDVTNDEPKKIAYKVEITEVQDYNNDGAVNLTDVQYLIQNDKNVLSLLKGNGDFRSQECIELLKEADIVVTNPPFSLFREYVAQLMAYNKKFLIIGNQNALTYRDIFHYLKDNEMWLGCKFGDMSFRVPHYFEPRATRYWVDETGQKWRSLGTICWFTNLDNMKRHEELILYRHYTPEDYPKYDNYNAIEVGKVSEIPCDYEGVMGVPITFMDKHNPEQFEIIGMGEDNGTGFSGGVWCGGSKSCLVNGKAMFKRIFIRRKK